MQSRTYYWLITALAIPAFVWLIPTIWMVSLSFQPNEVLARTTSSTALGLIPIPFTTENYAALFSFGQTPLWFLNSVIVAVGMTLGVLAVSTTAGYALARLDFPFKTPLTILCLDRPYGAGTGGISFRSTRCSPTWGGTTATTL